MTDAGVNAQADSGYHLYSFEDVRTDINTGDRVTNTVYFPTAPGSYVSNFSTNLEDLVGDNRISVVTEEDTAGPTQYNVSVTSEVDGLNDVGSPTGAGTYDSGSIVTSTVPTVVTNSTNNLICYVSIGSSIGSGQVAVIHNLSSDTNIVWYWEVEVQPHFLLIIR